MLEKLHVKSHYACYYTMTIKVPQKSNEGNTVNYKMLSKTNFSICR